MRRLGLIFLILIVSLAGRAGAQARYAADGPGTYIQVGGSGSIFHTAYGQNDLGGAAYFADAHLYRRIGVEAEARTLNFHESLGAHQTTYLVGPQFLIMPRTFRPYVKLLAGRGEFYFPYGYAKGSYFAVAAGAGVDWRLGRGRFTLRLIDVEVQDWPGFSFGAIHPYGIGSGIAVRVF
jgi:hypothetical protein